jgi:hypothetical protein
MQIFQLRRKAGDVEGNLWNSRCWFQRNFRGSGRLVERHILGNHCAHGHFRGFFGPLGFVFRLGSRRGGCGRFLLFHFYRRSCKRVRPRARARLLARVQRNGRVPQQTSARGEAQAKRCSGGSKSKPQSDRHRRAAGRRRCAGAARDCRAKRAKPPLPVRARASFVELSRVSLPLCDYGNGNVVCQLTIRAHVPERSWRLAAPRSPGTGCMDSIFYPLAAPGQPCRYRRGIAERAHHSAVPQAKSSPFRRDRADSAQLIRPSRAPLQAA